MQRMDAAGIVQEYLHLDPHLSLPFSLAHGVWPYGVKGAQNSTDVEPLHWSFNDLIHDTVFFKKSLLLPHPWLLLSSINSDRNRLIKARQANRCLLIGLPPSRVNDEALYASILRKHINIDSILIKPRGLNVEASKAFWKDKGIQPVLATSYRDLFVLLNRCEGIYCPSFSSIIFFAAAIGLRIHLLRDVPMYAYDLIPEETFSNEWIFDQKKCWARVASLSSSPAEIRGESLETLGHKYLLSPDELADTILKNLVGLRPSNFYALRLIPGRTSLQNKIHYFLSKNRLSFPALYSRGFSRAFSDRILSKIYRKSSLPDLGFMRFPSIDEDLSGCPVEVISRHKSSSKLMAGYA